MKKILMVAMVAIFAIACGSKEPTAEAKFNEYHTRIDALLEFVDLQEIDKAGPKAWFDHKEKIEKDAIAKACFELQSIQKEMMQWTKTLSPEDKAKIDELSKAKIADDTFTRKMRYVFSLQRIVRPITKPAAMPEAAPEK